MTQRLVRYMRSLLHVNANDLTFTELPDGSHKADFDVVGITFGDNGNLVDQVARSYTLRAVGNDYQQILKNGFVYFLTVPIKKAGAYQLRAALAIMGRDAWALPASLLKYQTSRKPAYSVGHFGDVRRFDHGEAIRRAENGSGEENNRRMMKMEERKEVASATN